MQNEELARRLGAAPSSPVFGRPGCVSWRSTRRHSSFTLDLRVTKNPSLVTSSATKKLKGPGADCTPGPCHFNKEQTPLASLRCQPAVSRRFFRCLGAHLLRSPSIVKMFPIADIVAGDGQSPPVERPGIPAPEFVLRG